MLFRQRYGEMRFQPQRRKDGSTWDVWCETGAQHALSCNDHVPYLVEHPDDYFLIHYANGAFHRIENGSPYWRLLDGIAQEYDVSVFRSSMTGGYVAWQRLRDRPEIETDGVRIMVKPDDMAELIWQGKDRVVEAVATDMSDDALTELFSAWTTKARERGVKPNADTSGPWDTFDIAIRRWRERDDIRWDAAPLKHDHREGALLTIVECLLNGGLVDLPRRPLYG